LLLALLTPACGGRESTASRSAAAYEEAQRKGKPVEKGEHSGNAGAEHAAASRPKADGEPRPVAAIEGHAHGGAGHATHAPASDHARMGHAAPTTHSQAGHGAHPPAAEQPRSNESAHAAMGHGAPSAPPAPEPAAASALPGQPAATLTSDAVDGPAPASLREALRAAEVFKTTGGHAMHHGTPYRQTDAGRDGAPPASPAPKPSPHHHHEGGR
jgi:hypothetical protein